MGGLAFAHAVCPGEPTLRTPRMSPEDYHRLKDIYIARLQECFPGCKVATLLEAPEKTDYGDIDIKICCNEKNIDFVSIADRIGAAGILCLSFGHHEKCTIAAPKDGSRSKKPVVVYRPVDGDKAKHFKGPATVTEEEYAQIDIEVLPSESYDWVTFYASYSDMASVLGRIVTPLGFKISDEGLILRMQELDDSKHIPHQNVADAEGMLCLSDEPARVMCFLGLSVEVYQAGFDTLEAFYRWLGECRLLTADAIQTDRGDAREKRRKQTRSVYIRFFGEWLPANFGTVPISNSEESGVDKIKRADELQIQRRRYQQEAIDFFNARASFELMHNALTRKIQNQTAVQLLKPIVALHSGTSDKSLLETLRAFRRWTGFHNSKPCVLGSPHHDDESQLYHLLDKDQMSLANAEATGQWVKTNWETVRALERQRGKVCA